MEEAETDFSVSALQKRVPGGIRTHDLPLRRRTLYPAELQKHLLIFPVFSRLSGLSGSGSPGSKSSIFH